MLVVIALLVFFSTLLLVHGIVSVSTGNQSQVLVRVNTYISHPEEASPVGEEQRQTNSLRSIGERLGRLAPKKMVAELQKELTGASIYLRGEEFAVLSAASGILGFLLAYLLTRFSLLGGLIGAYAGLVAPISLVRRHKRKRMQTMGDQLPEAMMMISNSLRAGFSFLQALELCAKEMSGPLAVEFTRLMKEINLGLTTEQALQAFSTRVPNDDVDMMVTAVLIQRETGGNLSEILENISDTIRERIRIKGEIRTLTAQGRLSGIIIGLLPVAITAFISVTNPDYMTPLITKPLGIMLILLAIVMEFIGVMLIRGIVNIRV